LVHLCPSFSEPGWATFAVAFRDAARPVGLGVTRRPDVHLFIVETLRGDAMRPEVMPFLSHWRDTECQPVGAAYAASNATHLSWFAMLSGKPPVFWDRARQAQRPAQGIAMNSDPPRFSITRKWTPPTSATVS
jgi:hypothetical protein